MKKRIFKIQTLSNLAVSFALFIFLIFFLLKREPLEPCDCVDFMDDWSAMTYNSLNDGQVTQFKEQKRLSEEQFQKQLDCKKEFQSYDRVNSLCKEERKQLEEL